METRGRKARELIIEQAEENTKLQPLLQFKDNIAIGEYFLKLLQARVMFMARTRMLKLKCKEKAQYVKKT